MKFCVMWLMVFGWLLNVSTAAQAYVLSGLTADMTDEGVSISMEVDGFKQYNGFALENPSRYVIDLEEMEWQISADDIKNKSDLITKIRFGAPKEGILRVVLDVSEAMTLMDVLFVEAQKAGDKKQLVFLLNAPSVTPKSQQAKAKKMLEARRFAARKEDGVLKADKVSSVAVIAKKAAPVVVTEPEIVAVVAAKKEAGPESMQSGYKAKGSLFGLPTFKADKPVFGGYEKSIFTQEDAVEDVLEMPAPKPLKERAVAPEKPKAKPVIARIPSYKPLIVLDAGHGGIDPGASSKSGMLEKNTTLDYVLDLRYALLQTGRYRVALTRAKDVYVPLGDRVKRARKAKGDLMISVHADAHANVRTRGFSVYTLSEARTAREARKLERKAGREQVLRGVDLSHHSDDVQQALIGMAQRDTNNTSATLAEILVKHMGKEAKLLRRPHRSKSLAVLTGADIPSVLIELGYLSNAYEAKLLRSPAHKRKIVDVIVRAVDDYYGGEL